MTRRRGQGGRRTTVAGFALLGTGMLGVSFSLPPGSRTFPRAALATALLWAAGAAAAGAPPAGSSGRTGPGEEVVRPALGGAGLFVGFYAAGRAARRVPPLRRALTEVLRYAERGATAEVTAATVANAIAEELFFRGAVYSTLGDGHPVALSSMVYTLTTVATRNPALIAAAAVTGTVWGGHRRRTGGVVAPAASHVVWSLLMLRFMPPLFRPGSGPGGAFAA